MSVRPRNKSSSVIASFRNEYAIVYIIFIYRVRQNENEEKKTIGTSSICVDKLEFQNILPRVTLKKKAHKF